MDRTQPHFACRKGILKKRGMLRKHELFSLSESPASNKQDVHNLIFQNKGPCPTCAEAVRRLSLPSPASFQLVDPRGKISSCRELFWHVYNIPKKWVFKEILPRSPPLSCKCNRVFLWLLTTCAHCGAISCKTRGTVENSGPLCVYHSFKAGTFKRDPESSRPSLCWWNISASCYQGKQLLP